MNDPFVSCPYDSSHRVPRSRIQGHIVKCQDKHEEIMICPYNATHRLPLDKFRIHIKICPSKIAMFPDRTNTSSGALKTPTPILQKDYLPETDPDNEIWDD